MSKISTYFFYVLVTFTVLGLLWIEYPSTPEPSSTSSPSSTPSAPSAPSTPSSIPTQSTTITSLTVFTHNKTPIPPDAPESYRYPIPYKSHMPCQSYHELNGISFDSLWEYAPISVFVGIFTIAEQVERRQILRHLYRSQQQTLIDDQVEYKFFVGKPKTPQIKLQLEIEQEAFGDLVILDIQENLRKGKGYAYWKWIAAYAADPQNKHVLFAKGDDDMFIHFQNFALNLRPLASAKYLYYGRERKRENAGWRTGMLFVLSRDHIEWIGKTKFPKKLLRGPEDLLPWRWFTWGNLPKTSWIDEDCLLYEDPRSVAKRHEWLRKEYAAPQTIAMHGMKEIWQWDGVIELFYGENQFGTS